MLINPTLAVDVSWENIVLEPGRVQKVPICFANFAVTIVNIHNFAFLLRRQLK